MRLFEGTQWDAPPKCDRCGKLESECNCPPIPKPKPAAIPPEKQTIRMSTEKRKRGKWMTVLAGFQFPDEEDRKDFLKKLKDHCGAGGTIQGEELEIQGDQTKKLRPYLTQLGYRLK